MIVPMSKITLLGLSSQKEALLRQLMRFGCVEVTDISDFLGKNSRNISRQRAAASVMVKCVKAPEMRWKY